MRPVIILLFLCSFYFTSCTKEELVPDLEGNLVAYAFTFDEFAELLDDHSGVIVTTSGGKEYTAITEKSGRYEFKRLPAGINSMNDVTYNQSNVRIIAINRLIFAV